MCDHDSIKRDPDRWSALPFVGWQSGYDSLGTRLEMRNCPCGSTLAKTIRRAWTEDEYTAIRYGRFVLGWSRLGHYLRIRTEAA